MLKLSENIKRKDLPEHIKEGLTPFPFFQVKFLIGTSTFFMLDLLILLPLIYPVMKPILYFTIPLLIFINIWQSFFSLRMQKKHNWNHFYILFLSDW